MEKTTDNKTLKLISGIGLMLLFVFLYPPEMLRISSITWMKVFLRLLAVAISGIAFLYKVYKEERISKLWLAYFVYAIWINITTLVHKGDIVASGYQYTILAMGILMFCDVFSCKYKEEFFRYLYLTLYILILANLYTWLKGETSLFANTNAWFNFYILMTIVGYRNLYNKKYNPFLNISYVVISIIMLLSSLQNKSLTTLFTLAAIYIYLLLFNRPNLKYIFNIPIYLLFNIILFYVIIINNGYFAEHVSVFLKKGVTFSGRTPIWKIGLEQIKNSFFTGHGVRTIEDMASIIRMGEDLSHFHNMYIQQMFLFGMIGTILFGIIFALVIKNITKIKDYKLKGFAGIVIFGILLRGQMETGMQLMLIFVLSLLYYFDDPERETNYISLKRFCEWKR